jgi:hypothetical protein
VDTKWLPVHLTDDEVRARGERIVALMQERTEADADAKRQRDAHKARVSDLDKTMTHLAHEVRTRTEHRDVEVKEAFDHDRGLVETVRLDTGEVVETRPMTARERQKPLDFPGLRVVDAPAEG